MLIDGYCDLGSWSTSTTLSFLMSLALQQVGWLSPTKPSTMILMGILYVIRDPIWFTWINWIICYVIMWRTLYVVHICGLPVYENSMMLCGSWFYQSGIWLCFITHLWIYLMNRRWHVLYIMYMHIVKSLIKSGFLYRVNYP